MAKRPAFFMPMQIKPSGTVLARLQGCGSHGFLPKRVFARADLDAEKEQNLMRGL
ncbi:MAG: hypothetical protein ACOX0U_03300 [Oscillospiraceae bacterium]